MKTKSLLFALMALSLSACSSDGDSPAVDNNQPSVDPTTKLELTKTISLTPAEETTNHSLNQFSFNFLNKAASSTDAFENNDGNISVSPLSASICLSTLANSGDKTLENAIAELLGEKDLANLNTTCNKLMRFLPSTANGAILTLANSAWYNNIYSPADKWVENLSTTFGTYVKGIEFEKKNVSLVNSWCSQNTNGRIPEIIDQLHSDGVVHLINALYFQGKWMIDFDPALTDSQSFDGTEGTTKVKMMHSNLPLAYSRNADFESVAVPFCGNTRIVLVMPAENKSASDLARTMTLADWDKALAEAEKAKVDLSLPKFKVESSADISNILHELGLPVTFNLDKMGVKDQSGRIVNGTAIVRQKTSAGIDEKGAEAAAITDAEIIVTSSGNSNQEEMKEVVLAFDRPFLYFIENTKTGTILLAGVVNNL